METTFLYVLTDPTTGAIRYLGKSNNPFERFKSHIRASEPPSHKKNWIDSLKRAGLTPHMDLLDEVPVSQWEFWEREYIRVFRAIGIPLTNQCDGGEGSSMPPEVRAKLSAARTGKKRSPESCAKQSATLTGGKHSAERCANISAALTGKKRTPETLARMSAAVTGARHPMFGKHQSSETRAKASAAKLGALNPMFGRTRSRESRAKQSATIKAKRALADASTTVRNVPEETT